MSSEPERPIEALLRAAAKKRREQGGEPGTIHPVTRRLLQQEVARRFTQKPQRQRFFSWLMPQNWPRPIAGGALLGVLAVVAFLLVPSRPQRQPKFSLAKNEQLPALKTSPALPVSTSAPEPSLKQNTVDLKDQLADNASLAKQMPSLDAERRDTPMQKDGRLAEESMRRKKEASAQPQPVNGPQQAPVVASGAVLSASPESSATPLRYGLARSPAERIEEKSSAALAGAPIEPAQESGAIGGALSIAAAPAAPQLARVFAGSPPSSAPTPMQYGNFAATQTPENRIWRQVSQKAALAQGQTRTAGSPGQNQSFNQVLNSFQVEQAGNQLRIIDSDGSIYQGPLGQIVPVVASATDALDSRGRSEAQSSKPRSQQSTRFDSTPNQVSPGSFFQVVGTNRSLNQRVFFTGTLIPDTNALAIVNNQLRSQVEAEVQSKSNSAANVPTENVPTQNIRLSGRVTIGDNQELELEAVPAAIQQNNR